MKYFKQIDFWNRKLKLQTYMYFMIRNWDVADWNVRFVTRSQATNLNGLIWDFNSMESAYFHNFAFFNHGSFVNLCQLNHWWVRCHTQSEMNLSEIISDSFDLGVGVGGGFMVY